MRSPLPWTGSKHWMASWVWQFLGDPRVYIEPFGGSLSVLLARPPSRWGFAGRETVNDLDGTVVNVWRSIKRSPDKVADELSCLSCSSLDLVATTDRWQKADAEDLRQRLVSDPRWHDPLLAAWTLHAVSLQIGASGGRKPDLQQSASGAFRVTLRGKIHQFLDAVAKRLRYVRILCHPWQNALNRAEFHGNGPFGVFLDPPYIETTGYRPGHFDFDELRDWCLKHGDWVSVVLTVGPREDVEPLLEDGWIQLETPRVQYRTIGSHLSGANDRAFLSPAAARPSQLSLPIAAELSASTDGI